MEILCEQLEKIGKEFIECGLPAVSKSTKDYKKYLCTEHATLALIAGFEPGPLRESELEK